VRTVVALGDGAAWIWRHARAFLALPGVEMVEIIDLYHAYEYLWGVGNAVFGAETAAAAAWVEPLKTRLYTEGATPLHAALTALARTVCMLPSAALESAAATAVRRALEYVATNAARLDYPAFVARQFPIGSGAVESSCKSVVQARTKGAGMRWSGGHPAGGQLAGPAPLGALGRLLAEPTPARPPPPVPARPSRADGPPHTGHDLSPHRACRRGVAAPARRHAAAPAPAAPRRQSPLAPAIPWTHPFCLSDVSTISRHTLLHPRGANRGEPRGLRDISGPPWANGRRYQNCVSYRQRHFLRTAARHQPPQPSLSLFPLARFRRPKHAFQVWTWLFSDHSLAKENRTGVSECVTRCAYIARRERSAGRASSATIVRSSASRWRRTSRSGSMISTRSK